MTAHIAATAGPRIAGDDARTPARTRAGGEAVDFTCILDACEAADETALHDAHEDDPEAPGDALVDNLPGIEMTASLFPAGAQAAPLQATEAPQGGTQLVSAAPTPLAIAVFQGIEMVRRDGVGDEVEVPMPGRAEPGNEAPDTEAHNIGVPKALVFASIEQESTFMVDWRSREIERRQAQQDEALVFTAAARNSDQGTATLGSPATQILTRIGDFAAPSEGQFNVDQTAPAGTAGTPNLPQSVSVRTLRIRLEPESLGEVEITLRQTAKGVRVEIQVAQSTTAETLSRDLSLLEDKLSVLLGASTASAAVSISLQSGNSSDAHPAFSSPQSFAQSAAGDGSPGGGSAGQREPRTEDNETLFKLNRTGTDEEESGMRGSARTGRVV